MADPHQFILAVFLMYGFMFTVYALSNGAIAGLPSANAFAPAAPATGGIVDLIFSYVGIIITFFSVMFISPFTGLWFMLPINWAILGTTIYLFIKIIRGGG